MGNIGNIKKSFCTAKLAPLLHYQSILIPAFMRRIITLVFMLKPSLTTKCNMHNDDSKKKCYRPQDVRMGNTDISGGENMGRVHYKKMRFLTEKFLNCV